MFANSPDERPLTRVFVTHMHPDHVGMAGWLTRKFGVRLWMTRLEYLSCRVMVSDTGREAPDDAIEFCRRAGWSAAAIEAYRARFGNFGKHIHTLPDSYRRLCDGEELRIGTNTWRVVVGSGHSPEHACLYCPELKVLISGDQILPRISSNVSVHPTEPEANPLQDWLDSCNKLKTVLPSDVLVLPAHNEPFRGAHLRLLVSRRNAGGRDGDGNRQALTAIQGRCHYQMVGGRTFGWNLQATGEARTWRQEVRRRGRARGGRERHWAYGGKAEGGEQYRLRRLQLP